MALNSAVRDRVLEWSNEKQQILKAIGDYYKENKEPATLNRIMNYHWGQGKSSPSKDTFYKYEEVLRKEGISTEVISRRKRKSFIGVGLSDFGKEIYEWLAHIKKTEREFLDILLSKAPRGVIGRLLINSLISIPPSKVEAEIYFVIDASSPCTVISSRVLNLLNIDSKKLEIFRGEIKSFSSNLSRKNIRVLKNATLTFGSNIGFSKVRMKNILIIEGYSGPSLLGEDFFKHSGLVIQDHAKQSIFR